MRRHTTKQPSGAATRASPRPNSRARSRKGSSTFSFRSGPRRSRRRRRPIGSRLRSDADAGLRARRAGQIVAVVVLVLVDGEGVRRLRPEQARVLGVLGHRLRHARAAHMAVEADDAVALGHHDVQVVRDQQHAEAPLGAQAADQGVELGLAGVVDRRAPARRAPAGRASGSARAPAPRAAARRPTARRAGARASVPAPTSASTLPDLGRCRRGPAERDEPRHGERDRPVDVEALRRVADDERLAAGAPRRRRAAPVPAARAPAWSCPHRWGRSP